MMQCGRVRSPLTCQAAIRSPTGTSIMGTHHASRIVPRPAPTRMAIFSPSPVLVGTDAARTSGPRMNARTRSGSHSNPPVAMTTPRAAPTSTGPEAVENRTPVIRRPSRSNSTARIPVRGSIAAVQAAACSSAPISPCPAPRSSWTFRR